MSWNDLLKVQKDFDKDCASYKIFSSGAKKSIEPLSLKLKAVLPAKKIFRPFFLVFLSDTNLTEEFNRLYEVFLTIILEIMRPYP